MQGQSQHVEYAVRCRSITKTYHTGDVETPALRGIDLDIRSGELLMLVGPSGCGKTTLISIMAAILNQDSGTCEVFGRALSSLTDRERTVFRGRAVGFVFQAYNLIPTLNCAENVSIPLLLAGVPRTEAIARSCALLERIGLGAKIKASPRDLSGGQQQRVAIARALIHSPRLVVCDEPTSALDADTGRHIMELFREVALADGRTLVIVTHDSRIFNFADRIARMNDGVIERIEEVE